MCIPETHTKWDFSEWERESYKMMMSNCQLFTIFTNQFRSDSALIFLSFHFPCVCRFIKPVFSLSFVLQSKSLMSKKKIDHFLCGQIVAANDCLLLFIYIFFRVFFYRKRFACIVVGIIGSFLLILFAVLTGDGAAAAVVTTVAVEVI